MDYYQYVVRVSNEAEILRTDQDWGALIPPTIDYAEQRIYRELDILNSRIVSTTTTFASSVRNFTIPSTGVTFIVIEQINAISTGGTRYQMEPVTKEFIDAVYPNTSTGSSTVASINGVPRYFAPISQQQYLIGPAPDATYTAEVVGTVRPATLSSANSSTFLTTYCPDLFMAASMVYLAEGQSKLLWEGEYQKLIVSANQEQLRARFEGNGWTPMESAPVQPPRV